MSSRIIALKGFGCRCESCGQPVKYICTDEFREPYSFKLRITLKCPNCNCKQVISESTVQMQVQVDGWNRLEG